MTIETSNITSGPYTGNGITASFSYTFRVDDKDELQVFETTDTGILTTLVVDVDYTVNDIGTDGGGTIDRIAGALPADYIWYIRSNRDTLQETDFESQGSFFPDVHERAFDKLTFLVQQLYDLATRSFRLADSDPDGGVVNLTLPAVAERVNRIVTFDENGDIDIAAVIGTFRGDWVTGTPYSARDLYLDPATNNLYFVQSDHTSTTVAADLAAGDVELLIDAEYVKDQADAAAASASTATTQAGIATTQAGIATTQAGLADTARTGAETAQALAEAAQTSTEAVLADFETKYLGAKAANPTLDNEDNALIDGAIYYNNVSKELRFYDLGTTSWGAVPTNAVLKTSDTGAAILPTGDTSERPGSPTEGMFRRNSETQSFEAYDGTSWYGVGGNPTESFVIAASDETTALTTGTAKVTFRMPYAFTLSAVRASVTTAPTGATITVDINKGGVSILSTLLTIDATEKTSATAATPAVISDSALSDDAEITIDIDQVGSTIAGAGLKITLVGVQA